MMRNNINRLKQLLERTKEYKEKFYKDRSFFNSNEADLIREDLMKRYEELRLLIAEANGGNTPAISLAGYNGVDVFINSLSSFNSTTAFHCLKVAPEYIIRAIAYYGGKKVTLSKKNSKEHYIRPEFIENFRVKKDKFNYKKLVKLLEELNDNYLSGNFYASSALIRAILDHVPPLLGCFSFEQVVNNYHWPIKTDKQYMKKLLDFKIEGHDTMHRPISFDQDLLEIDNLPSSNRVNRLLQECLKKSGEVKQIPSFKKKSLEDHILKTSLIKVELAENKVSWANYAMSHHVWSSFRLKLLIDNYKSSVPDYIKVFLIANFFDGKWFAKNFIFDGFKEPNENFRVEPHEVKKVFVFISDNPPGNSDQKPMPDIDRNTLKLIIETKSGGKFSIPIKAGWIVRG